MKKIIALIFLSCLPACKTNCSDNNSIASRIAARVEQQWNCKGTAAVQADLSKWLAKANLCQNQPSNKVLLTGPIATLACPILIEGLRTLAANRIPETWQCDPAKVGLLAADGLLALCNLIPL